jgi:hypothetical protein
MKLMAAHKAKILTEKWGTEKSTVGVPSRFGNRAADTYLSVKFFSSFFIRSDP